MENPKESRYVKRTQKDYTMSFKLQIVQEIERGKLSITQATKQHGIQCHARVNDILLSVTCGNVNLTKNLPQIRPKNDIIGNILGRIFVNPYK